MQKVREAAARAKCTNNIKQIGIACHSYNDVFNTSPPAVLISRTLGNNVNDENNMGPNWAVLILPYIEQSNLYNLVSASVQNYQTFSPPSAAGGSNDQGWRSIRATVIPTYTCPSESNGTTLGNRATTAAPAGTGWARGNYGGNMGPGDPATAARGGTQGGMNVPGGSTNQIGAGVLVINGGTTMLSVSNADGLSNTIMITHLRAGPNAGDMRGTWAFGQPGASTRQFAERRLPRAESRSRRLGRCPGV